jgi:hypothetical protein
MTMTPPLMPKATAVWLVDNTALTFEQIADFCGLHRLEVQAIADEEVAVGMHGIDPVKAGEVTQEEIDRCAGDPAARLKPAKKKDIPQPKVRTKGARYTPIARRQDRPDAIAWLLRNHPELSDAQIAKLIGTTKPTINAVRERTHANTPNIKPQNPVGLGLCSNPDLEKAIAVARARQGKSHAPTAEAPSTIEPELAPAAEVAEAAPAKPDSEVFADMGGNTPPAAPDEEEDVPTAESVFGPAPTAKPE